HRLVAMGFAILITAKILKHHCGSAKHRCIHHARMARRIASKMGQQRVTILGHVPLLPFVSFPLIRSAQLPAGCGKRRKPKYASEHQSWFPPARTLTDVLIRNAASDAA